MGLCKTIFRLEKSLRPSQPVEGHNNFTISWPINITLLSISDDEAKCQVLAAKGQVVAKGQVEVAAKGRYAEAKEVRGIVVVKGRGVSEEANRLHMLPFSLTKYSAIFVKVKGYIRNNNQLWGATYWSSLIFVCKCVRRPDCLDGIEPCECKRKGHWFRRLSFLDALV